MLDAGGGGILVGLGEYAVSYFSGLAAAYVSGRVQKAIPSIPNDTIPNTNAVVTGGAAAGITGDPAQALAAIAGSVTATLIHQGWQKLKKKF